MGKVLDAKEAKEIGLVHQVVESNALERSIFLANDIAKKGKSNPMLSKLSR